jgi:hypothetical protein
MNKLLIEGVVGVFLIGIIASILENVRKSVALILGVIFLSVGLLIAYLVLGTSKIGQPNCWSKYSTEDLAILHCETHGGK